MADELDMKDERRDYEENPGDDEVSYLSKLPCLWLGDDDQRLEKSAQPRLKVLY